MTGWIATMDPKYAFQVLSKYGAATLIALYLVYSLVSWQRTSVLAIEEKLTDHQHSTTQLVEQLKMQTWVLQRVCLNTARTAADRVACVGGTP